MQTTRKTFIIRSKMRTTAMIGNSGAVPKLEKKIKEKVDEVIINNKIVTGGATGVDTFVIEAVLEKNLTEKLTVYLTDPIEKVEEAYRWKKEYGVNEDLKKELERSKETVQKFIGLQPENVIDNLGKGRNKRLAQDADELMAFMSKASKGTIETINYAEQMGKNIIVYDEEGVEIHTTSLLNTPVTDQPSS